jgi:membrane fusion protein (multidrug efflux system)
MKRGIIITVVVVATLGLIGYVLQNNKKKNKTKTEIVAQGTGAVVVNTEVVKKSPIDLDFVSNGNFLPNQDLSLLSEISGKITQILVDEGSTVQKGQVIARIDDELLRVDLTSAEASYEKLKKDKDRYESAIQTGGITQQQLDDMRLNLKTAEARYQTAKRKLSDASIKAPISGVINKRYIETGSYIALSTKLFDIVDVSKLKLKVNANELQVINLQTGDPVSVTCQVFPDKSFKGKVSFIAAKADAALNYPVEIQIENSNNKLKAGMFASANFKFPKQNPAIMVQRSAFVGSVNSNKVFMLEGETAKVRTVVAGRIIGDRVEIIDGLKEGETVITSGQINLTDGAKVQIQK